MATRKDSTDAQMLFVGSACSHSTCNQHDFLPIRCDLCAATFCNDHFRPAEHQCAKFDPAKADRIAPSCPLCNTPVSIPPGQDPNTRMDAHIMTDCQAMGTKRTTTQQTKRCAGAKCNKVLIAPIRCSSCRKEFCPEHRFPQQHSCASHSASSTPKPSPSPTPQAASSRIADKLSNISIGSSRPSQSAPAAAAAMAAISRATSRPKPAASQPKPAAKPTPVATQPRPVQVTSQPRPSAESHPKPVAAIQPRPVAASQPRPAPSSGQPRTVPSSSQPRPAPSSSQPKPVAVQAPAGGSSSSKPSVSNPFNKTDRCDPTLPSSASADHVSAASTINNNPLKRPAPIDTSFRPPPIFGFA
ncbi:hypothetical protein BDV93DRAFT_520429 [Ceratobasidium sp. AG-I]|nr:hypothetical protein BDV93DRAFT_520429 [Ceratobasidium sp. AG-I]